MSSLVGGISTSSTGGIITEDDDRLKPQYVTLKHPAVELRDAAKDPTGLSEWTQSWWPSRWLGGFIGDMGDGSVNGIQSSIWHDLPEITRGSNGSYWVRGYARDGNGNILIGATLKLYYTASDVVQSVTTSASDGSYSLSTPLTGSHYIVAYLSGGGLVPDLEGTTVNTLTPGA